MFTFFLQEGLSCLYRCCLLASAVLFQCGSREAANPGPRVQGESSLNSDCHRAFIVWGPAGQPWGKNKMRVCGDLAVNSPIWQLRQPEGRQFSQGFSDLCGERQAPLDLESATVSPVLAGNRPPTGQWSRLSRISRVPQKDWGGQVNDHPQVTRLIQSRLPDIFDCCLIPQTPNLVALSLSWLE